MQERRLVPRVQVDLKAFLKYQEGDSWKNDSATVKDIGTGGVRLQLKSLETLQTLKNKRLNISILLSDNDPPLSEQAQVVWTATDKPELGLKFIGISPATSQKIETHFYPPSVLPSRIPHNTKLNYDESFVKQRREWLEKTLGISLHHLAHYSQPTQDFKGNIEQFIGTAQIPIGIAGPLKINGQFAKGNFYVPLATTEGALVMTYNRGMRVLTEAGGVQTRVIDDQVHISPLFTLPFGKATEFIQWIQANFLTIKVEAEKTTSHGKLLRIEPKTFGRDVVLKFVYFSADAQGLNMINKATEAACKFIKAQTRYPYRLRSNFSSVKKVAASNIHTGYGKRIVAEALIPQRTLKLLNVTAAQLADYFFAGTLAGIEAGMIGNNCHITNGIAAIFLACGQDAADIATSHIGTFQCQLIENQNLYVCVHLPNVLIGTVGGGTGLDTQKQCLQILDCYGKGKSKKFAEIIASTCLAGEIAVLAALATDTYVQAHEKYGRNRPKNE